MIVGMLRRFPKGLLGMLVLVVGVESFVDGHSRNFRHPWAWDWYLADRAARKKVADCEVLCFGDSLMKFGVSPNVIEQASGWKTYNLAVGVGQIPGSYFLLRRALEAGSHPKAILLDTIPHMMSARPDANANLWPVLLSYRDCFELSVEARDPHFLASMTLSKLLPSVRDRFEIRNSVTGALRGDPSAIGDILSIYLRNWGVNRGAQMTRRPPVVPPNQIEVWASSLLPDSWRPTPLNTHYLHQFLRLAEAHDIRVYWLIPPFDPAVQTLREAKGRDADYTAFLRSIQLEHPGVVVLDARHSGYGPSEHIDAMHLDVRGAASISRDLGTILRRDPSTLARWEVMPPFRDISAEVALEDVNQSTDFIVAEKARKDEEQRQLALRSPSGNPPIRR
jgi:hypothetical protein